ncbi:type IV pilus modification PilV family protein [Thermodesulfovibrio hydrogeniphilus]
MEESEFNSRGFTLIELIVAIVIMMVIMLGLLKGILEYNKFTIRAKMKDRATEIAKTFSAELERMPYVRDESGTPSIFYANNSYWNNVTCSTSCSFENHNSDGDSVLDFYDPYNGSGNVSNPLGNLNNLRLLPSSNVAGANCSCNGNHCPSSSSLPVCTYEGFSGRRIYAGVNIARIIDAYGRESGKAASVVVWYFEPFTDRLQQINTIVFKENK